MRVGNPRIPASAVPDEDALPDALRSLRQAVNRRRSATVPIGRRYRLAEDDAGRLVIQYRPPPPGVAPSSTDLPAAAETAAEPRTVVVLHDPWGEVGG